MIRRHADLDTEYTGPCGACVEGERHAHRTPRGRGHCAACDRVFTLTYAGTVPLHGGDGLAYRGPVPLRGGTCAGSNKPPKPGSVTAR